MATATANRVTVIPCGARTADLTWLLAKPGKAFYASVEKLRGIQERTDATLVFGHDAEQIHQLRVAPEGSDT